MSPWRGRRWITAKEAVADGSAVLGTFKYPHLETVHAYVRERRHEDYPYLACGLHGLASWERYRPETMDRHGVASPASVTCGRCRNVLKDVLKEVS